MADMLAVLSVVLPVFMVIGAGALAARMRWLADSAADTLMGYVVRFSVPCLLFSKMYGLSVSTAFSWPMIVSFFVGGFACFGLAAFAARRLGRRPGESVAIGFAAYFSNTVLIGLPVMTRGYGEAATEPVYAIIAFHGPLLYSFGMIAMEVSRQDGLGAWAALKRAGKSMLANMLMMGLLAGLALNLVGADLPDPLLEGVDLLGQAALPTALFALGAAMTRYRLQADLPWALGLSALLLVAHPLIVWVLTDIVFELDLRFVRAAVVTAALPAGMNVYVFAAMYHRAESVAASTVVASTAISVATISLWLAFLGGAG